MARKKRANPHETQAKISLVLSIVGGLSMLLLIVCVFRHFHFSEFAALYVKKSLRFYLILASTVGGLACGGIGFFLSLNSAGQKRNNLSKLAWQTFFIHAAIILVTACVFILFYFARSEVATAASG